MMSNVRPVQGENARTSNHTLHMEHRNHAVLTGVLDVSSFHENEIVLKVDSGLMIMNGDGLHIGKLLLEDGRLDVQGHIDSIVYESARKRTGSISRWFRKEK